MTEPKQVSRCMFCNSTSYGTGCPYSPHKKHVHVDNPRKCIYCGSVALGTGCPYNPFSRLHVRGVEYNMMTKESVYQSVMASIFLSRLTEPITEMAAFKLGIIDEEGRKIKEPITESEKAAWTPLDAHIVKIRRLIGENIVDLFKSSILLEMAAIPDDKQFNAEKYKAKIKIASDIDLAVKDLRQIFNEGIEKGFSKSCIENMLIDAIIKDDEHHED